MTNIALIKAFMLQTGCFVLFIIGLIFIHTTYSDPLNFRQAKKELANLYQGEHQTSFYCGCHFQYLGKKLSPDLKSCGYQVRKQTTRANRIEWEHIVPAWAFGHQLQCWQKGGRKACKKDLIFQQMEGDMHNLVPTIGEVNGDRSNYRFTEWNGAPNQYGQCDMIVDFKYKQVQPPKNVRGPIARAYFYMAKQYGLKLSKNEQRLFEIWDKQNPPDFWECTRNDKINKVQGNKNPFIKNCP